MPEAGAATMTVEELTAKLADVEAKAARSGDLQKEIDRLKKKLEDREREEEKARQAALTEQGKHKELADGYKLQIDALTPELEELRAERKARKEAEDAEKKVLLEKLPKEKQSIYANATLDVLRDVTASPSGPSPRPVRSGASKGEPTLEEKLVEAQKAGNIVLSVSLKRQIAEAARAA